MSDYGNIIENVVGGSQASASAGMVSNTEANPDDAARAFELAQSSGVPVEQIYGNLDSFERMYKGAMALQIVQQNPHLQDYANSHQLAPVVSNDDWGNLDTVSHAVKKVGLDAGSLLNQGIKAYYDYNANFAQKFMEGAGGLDRSSLGVELAKSQQQQEFAQNHRLAASVLAVLNDVSPAGLVYSGFMDSTRIIAGLLHATTSTIGGALDKASGTTEGSQAAEQFEQTIMDPGFQATMQGIPFIGQYAEIALGPAAARLRSLAQRTKPYLDVGIEPPRGVDSLIDHAKGQQAKVDIGNLMDALSEAQKSATRERNPEMFANFIRQHTNAEIGISSEAVRKLYGDSVPMPDDGLLGFVPDLHDQLLGAEPAGGDVRIPLADWLAKVDPKVAKDLRDDTRVRRGGLTLEEAKNLEPVKKEEEPFQPEQEAQPPKTALSQEISARLNATEEPAPKIVDTTMDDVDGVRRSGGLGVNSIKLKKTDHWTGRFANVHDYDFVDDKGEQVGYIQVTDNGKDLFVENVEHKQGPQALGARQIRDIARQLKQEFPTAKTISGVRVSGAREQAAIDQGRHAEFLPDSIAPQDWAGEHVTVPLKADLTLESARDFQQMIRDKSFRVGVDAQDEHWIGIGPSGDEAWFKPKKTFTDNERELVEKVHGVLQQIVPRMVRALPADDLQMGGRASHGMYVPFAKTLPFILWTMKDDAVGVARHEAIHHLRQYGFFSNDEWEVLKKAAISEGWMDKFNIRNRYRGQGAGHQLEEAIAEGFKQWYRKSWDESLGKFREADTPFEKVMQKLGRVYVSIKRSIKEVFGKDMDFNDIFDKVEAGEVGSRKGVKPLDPRMFKHPMADKDQSLEGSRPYTNPQGHIVPNVFEHPIKDASGKEVGTVRYRSRQHGANEVAIIDSGINDKADRGKGYGTEAYKQIVDWAYEQGMPVHSSGSTNELSNAVYERLRKQGYDVTKTGDEYKVSPSNSLNVRGDVKDQPELLSKIAVRDQLNQETTQLYDKAIKAQQEGRMEDYAAIKKEMDSITQKIINLKIPHKTKRLIKTTGVFDDQPELPGLTRISDRAPFDRGALKGMTKRTQDKYMELMQIRDEQDMEFAKKQHEKDVARRQTEEWKAEEKKVRDQVKPDFENRPDLAADKFLREGTLYGDKLKGKPKLDSTKLTPEQKAALPKDYHSVTGLHPDDAAGLFGYHSGNELVDALSRVHADRQASGLTAGRYVNSLVDNEVARRMKAAHGDLAENILSETQDHVISQTQFDMLHEETLAAAMQAGIDVGKSSPELPFTKEHMEQFARQRFSQLRMGQVSVEAHLRDGLRANELAERALLDGDFTEAFRQKQKQAFSFLYAREAKKVEKQRTQFEKSMKRFSSREVSGVDQTYTNFIHQIMVKIGYGIKRSIQDLNYHIGRSGFDDLEAFWREKTDPASIDPREMPIAEFLMDPNYKKQLDGMSVDEFRAVNDSVKSMITNGRNEKTILRNGEKEDLEETRQELIDQLDTFATKQVDEQGLTSGPKTGIGGVWRGGKTLVARLLQLESIFNRIDRGSPKGLFNTLFSYPAAEASNHFAALTRKYAAQYRELKQFKVDLTERIPNSVFIEPISRGSPDGEYFIPMTRKGLRAVLQNAGNASNLDKLARGYEVEPKQVMDWLHKYAKKEDWDWAQAQGKIWDGIFHEAGIMVENLSGLPPEKIPLQPIDTQFGKYDGWYHKIVYDPNREGTSKKLMGPNAEEQLNFTRATTPRSWEKSRTGYAAPIDLNLDRTPIVMGQVLRDIAFRPFIHEASKIFYDNKFRMAVTRHFGDIYKDMLVPYLRDMGSTRNVNSPLGGAVDKWLEWSRQNIISTLIGLNPHTIYKHTFSAAINSIGEVGVADFAREFKSLWSADPVTGQSNWEFAMQKSEELQRRHQQWVETLGGAHEEAIGESGGLMARARSANIRIGSAPIAFFDLASAVPTFLAKYRNELEAGSTEGEAIALGNRSVRHAHGSTAVSSRPEAMRGNAVGRMLTSLYGFFNQMLQRQYEMGWRSKEMVGDFKQGEYERGREHLGKITTLLVTSVIAPAMIEEMVTGHHGDDKEGWIERVSKGIVGEMSSGLPVVRDVAHALINKEDPSIGLLSTPYHEVKNLITDVSRPGASVNRQHGGDLAKHILTVIGMFTGLANAQEAKLLKFGIDVKSGAQRPNSPMEVYRGLASGQSKKHP